MLACWWRETLRKPPPCSRDRFDPNQQMPACDEQGSGL